MSEVIDLGHGHTYSKILNDNGVIVGIENRHPNRLGFSPECIARIPVGTAGMNPAAWDLINENPLTLSPSLKCSCGEHGFIRDGKWIVVQ